jgi:exosome complex component RRP41
MVIRNTFEAAILTTLYPQSQIDIFIYILQADGGATLDSFIFNK